VDRKKKETWPLSTSDDNRGLTVGIAGCARPGPQVPDAMPTSIARQVNEWQVRESEVRECVLVPIKRITHTIPDSLRSKGRALSNDNP
jgi:hypothetical protein